MARSPLPMLSLAALVACQGRSETERRCLELPATDSPVVARVGELAITAADIERRLHEQGSAAQRYTNDAGLRRFIDDQIRLELLAQAALERGLDRDPDVIDAARKVMVRKLLLQDLGPQAWGEHTSEEAIRKYYESHLEEYQQPEKRRLAHVQLAPTPEGRALAQSFIDRLRDDADRAARHLSSFAEKSSLDRETRGRGGELPSFVSQAELSRTFGPNFADEAFKLGIGEVGPAPIQSTRGWHVVLTLARREAYVRGIDEVREEIRGRLLLAERSQAFEEYLRAIRQRYPVALYEDRLPELTARVSGEQGKRP